MKWRRKRLLTPKRPWHIEPMVLLPQIDANTAAMIRFHEEVLNREIGTIALRLGIPYHVLFPPKGQYPMRVTCIHCKQRFDIAHRAVLAERTERNRQIEARRQEAAELYRRLSEGKNVPKP